jgi:hypothetical protein
MPRPLHSGAVAQHIRRHAPRAKNFKPEYRWSRFSRTKPNFLRILIASHSASRLDRIHHENGGGRGAGYGRGSRTGGRDLKFDRCFLQMEYNSRQRSARRHSSVQWRCWLTAYLEVGGAHAAPIRMGCGIHKIPGWTAPSPASHTMSDLPADGSPPRQ